MERGTDSVVDMFQKARRNVSKRVQKRIEKVLHPEDIWKRVPSGLYRVKRKSSNLLQPLTQHPHGPVVLKCCRPIPLIGDEGPSDSDEGTFVIHRLLRGSATSEVYEASLIGEDEGLIALQIVPLSYDSLKQLANALSVMRATTTPSVIRYDAIYQYGQYLLLVMPWSVRLNDILALAASNSPSTSSGLLREEFIVRLAFELLVALRDIHRTGFVHGSLSTSAVLVDDDCNFYIDGLLHAVRVQNGRAHEYVGTVGSHMPPEQLACSSAVTKCFQERKPGLIKLSERGYGENADVWALGILIYETVMGASAYGNDPGVEELVDSAIDMEFEPLDECAVTRQPYSSELQEFVKRCLNRNSTTRPSVAELLEDPLFEVFKSGFASLEDPNAQHLPVDSLDEIATEDQGPLCLKMLAEGSLTHAPVVHVSKKVWKSKAKFNSKLLKKNHRCICIKLREPLDEGRDKKTKLKMTSYQVNKDIATSVTDGELDLRFRQAYDMKLLDAGKFLTLYPSLNHVLVHHHEILTDDNDVETNPVTFIVPFQDQASRSAYNPQAVLGCAVIEIWN